MNRRATTYRLTAAASGIPFAILRRLAGDELQIPVYHTVSDAPLAHIRHLYRYKSVDQFVCDVEFMVRHYTPIGLTDLLEFHRRNKPIPPRSFLLTFDDGLREIADVVAPILVEKNVPATFFLTTAFLDNRELFYKHKASVLVEQLRHSNTPEELNGLKTVFGAGDASVRTVTQHLLSTAYEDRQLLDDAALILGVDFAAYLNDVRPYMTSEQIRDLLAQGFAIGAHSHDHPVFQSLPLGEQVQQAVSSMKFLSATFSFDGRTFAFPFNDRGISTNFFNEAASDGGIELFFGTSSMMTDSDPRCIQRTVMETLPIPASTMLSARYARMLVRRATGRNQITRARSTDACHA